MKTLLKFLLCLAICTGSAVAADAQNIRVTGKVTAINGMGIAGVHIFDSIAKIGATSDINGVFSLNIPKKATKLRFSHIAFETKYLSLTEKHLADTIVANTIWLEVELTQKIKELAVVEISDAKVEIAYKNAKQWILDYEPVGTSEFLLLLLEKNKKYLQLVNSNHEKISQIAVNKNYNTLLKDCFGNFHLLSVDSACQIFLMEDKLTLPYRYIRHEFDQIMRPLVVNTDNYLYTKSYSVHGQLVSYNKIHKVSKEITPFVINFEKDQAVFNRYYNIIPEFIACNAESGINVTPEIIENFQSLLISAKNVGELFRLKQAIAPARICVDPFALIWYMTLVKSPYSLLEKLNDTLYFFDHLNNDIATYDLDGNYIKEVSINYHNNKNWDKEIIVNEEKTRCFAKFTRNGETSLVEINPNTGQTMGRYVLETHAFPTKIKVRGNEIHYLSKDHFEGEEKYFLWRQRLE